MILRRLNTAFRKQAWFTLSVRPLSANSGLITVRPPNDWAEVALPDADPYDQSQLGANLP
jgi:hypothetical protein